ncbi:MAG: lipase [Tildeniella nuda ZEHNDER 1965/U140]|jgi:triacylglycerol esterase/lipase EstA (alpha/beta hydrolase family)|nr:lipase [Tildeniella nuda ZEHNDER 1965/U140]
MPRPIVILPGYLAGAVEYRVLEKTLQALGFPTVTVPLRWQDWVPTIGGRSVAPILRILDTAVQQVLQQYDASKVTLIGHSAGGWLARIYLGEKPYCVHPSDANACAWSARDRVATLITLGTPHTSLERWTRKNLDFVNLSYPGAFYADVRYVCVAGKAVYGDRWRSWLAFSSYKLTCGQGNTWGDGITPIEAAHLKGAENLTLEGAMHSPRGNRTWYGSPDLLEHWTPYLV